MPGPAIEAGYYWRSPILGTRLAPFTFDTVYLQAAAEYLWLPGPGGEGWHAISLAVRPKVEWFNQFFGEDSFMLLGIGAALQLNMPEKGRADPNLALEASLGVGFFLEVRYTWSRPVHYEGGRRRERNLDTLAVVVSPRW